MELSKLVEGQEALVIDNTSSHTFKKGDIVCCAGEKTLSDSGVRCKNEESSSWVKRADLLCVGDKVVRGPDWDDGGYQDNPAGAKGEIGIVTGFNHDDAALEHNVDVDWPSRGKLCHHRMTPDHQDLQPVGDSVDEGRPGIFDDPDWEEGFDPCNDCPTSITAEQCHGRCFNSSTGSTGDCPDKTTCKTCQEDCIRTQSPVKESDEPEFEVGDEVMYLSPVSGTRKRATISKIDVEKIWCKWNNGESETYTTAKNLTLLTNEPKPIKETVIMATRKQRARDLEKTKREAVDARDAAIEKHEEDLAQRNESLDALDEAIAAMNDSVTDKEARIKLIAKANKVDMEQAEAMYELDKLNE